MVSVRKSPNMMSTTGRNPVIAAPTPIPVKPASEMGVSSTRSAPNSSTNPESTLNGVPASATSSPKIHTRESRSISSASASRTACAKVSSRSGINVLVYLIHARIGRGNGKLHSRFHLTARFRRDLFESRGVRLMVCQQPARVQFDRIPLGLPMLLFLLGAVVLAINIAHVMSAVTVSIGLQECRAVAGARPLHQPRSNLVNRAYILAVHRRALNPETCRAS